jgi:Tfp pilus assembly protein PilF
MKRRLKSRLILFALLVPVTPSAALARGDHLIALRDWQWHTEEAAKYLNRGDYAKAEQRVNLAIKEIRPYLPETRRIMARSYCELARILYHEKRYADAEPLAKWALAVREEDKKASPNAIFQSVYTLASIHAAQKHYDKAEPLLKRALALQEKNLGLDHANSIATMTKLAMVHMQQANYAAAEPLYRRAISIEERTRPEENLDLADTAEEYAKLLRHMKRDDDAEKWQARALKIRDTVASRAARAKADRFEKEFQSFK